MMLATLHCCSTYDAASGDFVTRDQGRANHCTDDATAEDNESGDGDDGCYQFPLPFEQIYWIDSSDTFHSAVSHIAQVRDTCLTGLTVANPWVVRDCHLNFTMHVQSVCKSVNYLNT